MSDQPQAQAAKPPVKKGAPKKATPAGIRVKPWKNLFSRFAALIALFLFFGLMLTGTDIYVAFIRCCAVFLGLMTLYYLSFLVINLMGPPETDEEADGEPAEATGGAQKAEA